jgi:hypothetical protein
MGASTTPLTISVATTPYPNNLFSPAFMSLFLSMMLKASCLSSCVPARSILAPAPKFFILCEEPFSAITSKSSAIFPSIIPLNYMD